MPRKLKVDFTNVESYIKCEEGEHIAILREIEEKVSSSNNDMLTGKFEVVNGSSTGAVVYNNFTLTEKSLWVLKSFLDAVGMKAEGKVLLDIDKIIGKKCIISVLHEEYNGNMTAKINGFKALKAKPAPAAEEDDEYEEEEEAPKPKPKAPSKPAPKKPPVEVEDEEEEDEEPAPPPKKKAPTPPPAKAKAKAKPVAEDDDDDWEEA